MDINELARKYMGETVFKASDLLEAAPVSDLPPTIQYAVQHGRNVSPVKAMGRALAVSDGIEKVGQAQKTNLWQVKA